MADREDLWANGANGVTLGSLGKGFLARSTPGIFYGLDGWTAENGTIYICVFDAAALVANANPVVPWPKAIIELTAAGNYGLTEPPVAEYFANGIWIGVSSTAPPNFTLTANNSTHFHVLTGPIFGSAQP